MALIAATSACGATVEGADGSELGSITDLMFDCDSGAIAYAVLAHGGLLGVGEKLFAVPWAEFEAAGDGRFRLQATADALERAAGIDKDAWPPQAPSDWLA